MTKGITMVVPFSSLTGKTILSRYIFGAVLFLYCNFAAAFTYTLELTETEIQTKAEAMMPLEKKKFFVTSILTNPIVDLIASTNEIGLSSDIQIKAPGNISGKGSVSFSGSLRYENDTGSFYFDNLNITELEIEKVPETSLPKIKKMLEFVASKFLTRKPVYKFKDNNLKHKLAKATLKSIKVENETLLLELGLF